MRVMTADPGPVEDIAIGDDAGGLQALDEFQQRLIGGRAATRPEVRVGEDDDAAVNDLGGALAPVGPRLRVCGLCLALNVDRMGLKGDAAFRHFLAAAVNLANLDAQHSGDN